MKKLISPIEIVVVGTIILGVLIGNWLMPKEEVKRRMYIPDNEFRVGFPASWNNGKKKGEREFYDLPNEKHPKGDGKWDYSVSYIVCGNERSGYPFATYDRATKELDLDNDIKKSINTNVSDGFVDETIENPRNKISYYAPNCP